MISQNTPEWSKKRVNQCATRLFLYCFLAYACSYIGRKNFSACIPAMTADGFLSLSFGGTINSAYMLVYGAGQMLNGILGTRIKPRYMIGTGLCGAGLCNLAMGLTPTAAIMPLIWALNGLFHSMLWAPIIRTFTDLLPGDRRESAGTNIVASCSIGAVLAFLIPGFVLKHADWRVVFYVSGGILLVAFLVWVIGNRALSPYIKMMEKACIAEREALRELASSHASEKERKAKKGDTPSLLRVFLASGLWVVIFGLVCNGALRDAVESWAPSFLADQFQLDSSMAAITSVIIPVVSITGTYFSNWLFEKKLKNELVTTCVMFAIAAACVGGLILCRPLGAVPCALLMAISVSAMWGANHMFLTVIPYRFASLGLSAAITGILNSVIYFATALCSMLYGILADRVGWSTLILVWLGVGVLGMAVCLAGAKHWGHKRTELDAGRI